MGKPVVATKTDAMELFSAHTYLCSSLAEYQDAVEQALKDAGKEKAKERISFARSHSWSNNVHAIYQSIQENLA